jgi:hypothetical protein
LRTVLGLGTLDEEEAGDLGCAVSFDTRVNRKMGFQFAND